MNNIRGRRRKMTRISRTAFLGLAAALCLAACGDDPKPTSTSSTGGTGGNTSTGGSTGGNTSTGGSTGGNTSTGGSTGVNTSTGGSTGVSSTGGSSSTAGS